MCTLIREVLPGNKFLFSNTQVTFLRYFWLFWIVNCFDILQTWRARTVQMETPHHCPLSPHHLISVASYWQGLSNHLSLLCRPHLILARSFKSSSSSVSAARCFQSSSSSLRFHHLCVGDLKVISSFFYQHDPYHKFSLSYWGEAAKESLWRTIINNQ